jgi:hypothetical protein
VTNQFAGSTRHAHVKTKCTSSWLQSHKSYTRKLRDHPLVHIQTYVSTTISITRVRSVTPTLPQLHCAPQLLVSWSHRLYFNYAVGRDYSLSRQHRLYLNYAVCRDYSPPRQHSLYFNYVVRCHNIVLQSYRHYFAYDVRPVAWSRHSTCCPVAWSRRSTCCSVALARLQLRHAP